MCHLLELASPSSPNFCMCATCRWYGNYLIYDFCMCATCWNWLCPLRPLSIRFTPSIQLSHIVYSSFVDSRCVRWLLPGGQSRGKHRTTFQTGQERRATRQSQGDTKVAHDGRVTSELTSHQMRRICSSTKVLTCRGG